MKITRATPVLFVDQVEPTRGNRNEGEFMEPGGHVVTFARFDR